jgi:hypothetical protein
MTSRPGWMVVFWLVVSIGCFVAAGALQPSLDASRERYELVVPGNVVAENHPGHALLTIAPGGLRTPLVNYLWIRSDARKQAGRHYEAMQLADLVCQLMPRFPGVWAYHAWDMAWNISVTKHTREERWLWVTNGVRLLRDRGIPMNPKARVLYKELAWIFFSKMGQTLDDMHLAYKQRWAKEMQNLLAAPIYGETQEVIDAFRPIAQASVDKDPRRQGRDSIQTDRRDALLTDPELGRYAALLAEQGVGVDRGLLDAYNRFSREEAAEIVRIQAPQPRDETQRAIYRLINDPSHANARGRLLAFVRAQILWNDYKMDPAWMLEIMERYNAPLDWRMVQAHGLYWVTYGREFADALEPGDVESLNTDRIVLNNLKALTWNGRLTYQENPSDPDYPEIGWLSDWRYIKATHEAHFEMGTQVAALERVGFDRNRFRDGHINYLIAAVKMLYAGYRHSEAQYYFDWLKENYIPDWKHGVWDLPLEEFVIAKITEDGSPIADLARNQLQASTVAAYESLARGNVQAYRASLAYAARVYKAHQDGVAERSKLPPLKLLLRNALSVLLVRPQVVGTYLDLEARNRVWSAQDPEMQRMLFDLIAPPLRRQCAEADPPLDFAKAFPEPPGLESYRAQQRQRMVAPQ